MIWIILGIVLFLFLVLIHELWHFIAAKKTGVQVLEFGMWIPPKVATLRTDKSWTEYTLNAIPLWWFVRLKGEDPSDPGTFHAKDSFIKASFLSKTIILLAGVTVNFFFAWWVLTILFWRGISPLMIVPENASPMEIQSYLTPTMTFLVDKWLIHYQTGSSAQIDMVVTWWVADRIGLQAQDTILQVNTISVDSFTLKKELKKSIGKDLSLSLIRDGKELNLTGSCPIDNCVLGVVMNDLKAVDLHIRYKFPLVSSIRIALSELWYQAKMTLYRLGKFWSSLISLNPKTIQSEAKNFSGPVGAVKFGDILIQNGLRSQFLAFGAMISFALAVFNLLPIPALDGGRWLWVIIQSIFFRKKEEKYFIIESYLNFVVFRLLMILGIYIILKDLVVARWVNIPWMG